MKLDIKPIIEKATEEMAWILKGREIEELYVVRRANGEDHTIMWTLKDLEEFLPNRKVSEVMLDWEESNTREIERCRLAISTKKHPTFTSESKEGVITPRKLDKYDIAGFRKSLERALVRAGKLTLVKIIKS